MAFNNRAELFVFKYWIREGRHSFYHHYAPTCKSTHHVNYSILFIHAQISKIQIQYFSIKPKAVYLWVVKYQIPWNQGIDFQLANYLVSYSWQLWYAKDIRNISPSMKMGDLCRAMMYGQRWWDLLQHVVGCVVEMKAVIRSVIMRRPSSVLSVAYKKMISAEISSLTQAGIRIAEKVVFLSFFLSFFEFSNYTYRNEPRHGKTCLCHLRTTKTQTRSLPRQNDTSSLYIRNFKILICLCSWAGQFVSCLVGDSLRHMLLMKGIRALRPVKGVRALRPIFAPIPLKHDLSRDMTKPTIKVTVRPAKTQISLGIRPVWSESSLCA